MRMKADRQLPLRYAGTRKLTQDWFDGYQGIHAILEANPSILELVHKDLTEGQKKLKRNFDGVPSECIFRLAIIQQIEGYSFRDLIVRVDDSEMLRFFCRFYDDPMIAHSTYAALVNLIQPKTWDSINKILVNYARKEKGFQGHSLRTDTTAVETDIHYPTDSALLYDCVRVLSRLIAKVRTLAPALAGSGRARTKDAKKLAFEIARGGKKLHKAKQKKWYGKLIAATERVLHWATGIQTQIDAGEVAGEPQRERLHLKELAKTIAALRPLVEKCVHQARQRVLLETPVPNEQKIFSIFEPHTELLIRGKAGKDVEFGHMLELSQIERGLITQYAAHSKRPSDVSLLEDAVKRHKETFDRAPKTCAADKGFYSEAVLKRVMDLGVEEVCVPKKGRRNNEEENREHSRWFKLGQAFRAGVEGTISVLKRAFGLRRCLRHGFERFASWVGSGVVAHNLVLLART
jgi:transposase, IS5 family